MKQSRAVLVESKATMAKFSLAVFSALMAGAAAFAPASSVAKSSALQAKGEIWDPMGLYELGSGKAFDTFPNMFPDKQYLEASEIKHGRQAMLAWTGVWATSSVRFFFDEIFHIFDLYNAHAFFFQGRSWPRIALPRISRRARLDQGSWSFRHRATCLVRSHLGVHLHCRGRKRRTYRRQLPRKVHEGRSGQSQL